jgi:chromosome segregation ATPase
MTDGPKEPEEIAEELCRKLFTDADEKYFNSSLFKSDIKEIANVIRAERKLAQERKELLEEELHRWQDSACRLEKKLEKAQEQRRELVEALEKISHCRGIIPRSIAVEALAKLDEKNERS